ncbi:MAG: HEAT repeat domain-containing protein [Bryobacteraceae bacterium]
MTCESALALIPLYHYGDLTPEQEDALEAHVHECGSCAQAMNRQQALARALDRRELQAPPLLLEDCRADLMAAIQGGAATGAKALSKGPWTLFLEALGATFAGLGRVRQPLAAAALVTLGFFGARLTATKPAATAGNPAQPAYTTVRSISTTGSGAVEIAVDDTTRRVVSGGLDDPAIQQLVLAGSREDNPAVRVESVDLLKNRPASGEIRDALVNALAHDVNPAVRMKALEGLKPLAGDPQVRQVLAQALIRDDNPVIRMQAVDLLVAQRDDSMVGVLQNLVQHEDNNYVRLKVAKALKDMNASVGTF